MIHNPIDIAEMIHAASVTNRSNRVTLVALCWAESRFNDQAELDNTTLTPPGKGRDRGLFQINSFWHPEVTDACAFDPVCNIKEAIRIWRSSGLTQWAAYNNGAYKAFLPEAEIAVEAQVRLRALAKAKDAEKAAIQAEVDRLKGELELMRQARVAAEDAVKVLQGQLAAANVRIADLTAQVVNGQDALVAKQVELAAARSALDSAHERLETAKRNLTALHVEEAIAVFGD